MAMKRKAGSWSSNQVKKQRTMRRRMRRSKKRPTRRGRSVVYTKIMRQPVPDKMYTTLKYVDNITLAPTSAGNAGAQSYAFGTSLYDPDQTSFGHQPLWLDQLMPMYTTYRVHGIKYRFTFVNTNTTQMFNVVLQHSAKSPENPIYMNTIRERRGARAFTVGPYGSRPTTRSGFLRTGTPWGLTKREMIADEDFEGGMGANPTKISYINIYGSTEHSSAIVNVSVQLTYYVELTGRKQVVGS